MSMHHYWWTRPYWSTSILNIKTLDSSTQLKDDSKWTRYYGVINSWYEKTKQTTRSNGLSLGDDKYVWLSEPQKSKSYLLEAVLKLQKLQSNDPGSEAALQFNETGSCDPHHALTTKPGPRCIPATPSIELLLGRSYITVDYAVETATPSSERHGHASGKSMISCGIIHMLLIPKLLQVSQNPSHWSWSIIDFTKLHLCYRDYVQWVTVHLLLHLIPRPEKNNSSKNLTLKTLLQAKSNSIWLITKPVVWSWKP
jgi:hypothetical protein